MVLNSGDIFLKGGFSYETILPLLKCLLSKWFHPSTPRVSELFHQKLSFWGGNNKEVLTIKKKIKLLAFFVASLLPII